MNSNSGIQELMAAETRASQIVAEARMGKWNVAFVSWLGKQSQPLSGVQKLLLLAARSVRTTLY